MSVGEMDNNDAEPDHTYGHCMTCDEDLDELIFGQKLYMGINRCVKCRGYFCYLCSIKYGIIERCNIYLLVFSQDKCPICIKEKEEKEEKGEKEEKEEKEEKKEYNDNALHKGVDYNIDKNFQMLRYGMIVILSDPDGVL